MVFLAGSIAYGLVRSQINVNANSGQAINITYITPLEGKLKFLITPSAPINTSLTDTITQPTFNMNSGSNVYGEYEMDINKLVQINSITLTNNNSSAVMGYLTLLYEVG